MSVENNKIYLLPIKYAVSKFKVNFIDLINYAIENDLVKLLYTLVIRRCVHRKLGQIEMVFNECTLAKRNKIRDKLLEHFDIVDEKLEDIKLELSCMAIKKKYNLPQLLIDIPDDNEMTDQDKILHLMTLIQCCLRSI